LLRLTVYVMRDYPEFYPLFGMREFTYAEVTQRNRNELLFRDPYVDGVKTGHTDGAGFCLIASAKRDDRRMIVIVMGTASELSRAIEAQKLLNYGFEHFETVKPAAFLAAKVEVEGFPVGVRIAGEMPQDIKVRFPLRPSVLGAYLCR